MLLHIEPTSVTSPLDELMPSAEDTALEDEFLALVFADQELVDAEFDALVEAGWGAGRSSQPGPEPEPEPAAQAPTCGPAPTWSRQLAPRRRASTRLSPAQRSPP